MKWKRESWNEHEKEMKTKMKIYYAIKKGIMKWTWKGIENENEMEMKWTWQSEWKLNGNKNEMEMKLKGNENGNEMKTQMKWLNEHDH